MNKQQFIDLVAEKSGFTRAQARIAVSAVFESVVTGVSSGEKISLIGFGSFDAVDRPARVSKNPRTGKPVMVAAKKAPRFRAGRVFKEKVKSQNS